MQAFRGKAVSNARYEPDPALDKLKLRERLQAALIDLGRRAATLAEPDQFMQQAAEILRAALGAGSAEVMELTPDRAQTRLVAGAGWAQDLAGKLTETVEAGSYGCQALAATAPIVINGHASKKTLKLPDWLRSRRVRSGIRVSVRVRGEPWGLLGVHSGKPRTFTKDEISFMRIAAHLAGLVITRARCEEGVEQDEQQIRASLKRIRISHYRLAEHIRRRDLELEATREKLRLEAKGRHRAEDTLRLLVEVMAVTTEAPDISSMLQKSLETVCRLRGWEAGQVWRHNPARNSLFCFPDAFYATRDFSAFRDVCLNSPLREDEGLAGRVWKRCEAVWVEDLSDYSDCPHAVEALKAGLQGAFALPVCLGKKFLGVMEFLSAEVHPPDADWLDAMTRLGNHVGVVLQRLESEARLRREKAFTDSLIRSSTEGIFAFDCERRLTVWNPAMERITGIPASQVLGRPAFEAVPQLREMGDDGFLERTLQGKQAEGKDHACRFKGSGEEKYFESYYSPVWETSGRQDDPWKVTGGLAIIHDATERKQFEESLRSLSGRLLRLQDEERRRLARELHDGACQTLTALSLHLLIVEQRAQKLSAAALASLRECQTLAQQAHNETRNLSHLLHPPVLEAMGLLDAIRGHAKNFRNTTGIALRLNLPARMDRLPPEVEIALFRIFQEALANMHRHSGSLSASVRLTVHGAEVRMEVADKGKGMPSGISSPGVGRVGIGLLGMQERLKQLGGRMEISSSSKGTTVRAILSLAPPQTPPLRRR